MLKIKKQILIIMVSLFAGITTFGAQAETFREGVDYKELEQPVQTADPSKIEVREFFWFGCLHCFKLEPFVKKFADNVPEGVAFVQTPAPLNKKWVDHAHAFYVMEALGKKDAMAAELFDKIHVERAKLFSQEQMLGFFKKHGVSESDYNKLFQSFSIRTKVRQAEAFAKAARLSGVPAIVVNGKYVIGTEMAKGFPRMMQIVNFLIEKEKVMASSGSKANG